VREGNVDKANNWSNHNKTMEHEPSVGDYRGTKLLFCTYITTIVEVLMGGENNEVFVLKVTLSYGM
jgi:hypothetical protein